jgi:hypothetical protein
MRAMRKAIRGSAKRAGSFLRYMDTQITRKIIIIPAVTIVTTFYKRNFPKPNGVLGMALL